ncbi:MAG: hypothetical protein Q4A71_02365 [Actinomycetaceae bacterium]|nr:hypothetical protein [Actinomycetaceae bacterium]
MALGIAPKQSNNGATVFVTSHHLDELSTTIDSTIGIEYGKFIGEYSLASDDTKSLQDFYQEVVGFSKALGAEQ